MITIIPYSHYTSPFKSGILGIELDPHIITILPYSHYYRVGGGSTEPEPVYACMAAILRNIGFIHGNGKNHKHYSLVCCHI